MIYTKRVVDGVVVDIPDGVEYVEPEVRQLARSIAAEIRENGHWQGGTCMSGSLCVGIAPSFRAQTRVETDLAITGRFPDVTGRLAKLCSGSRIVTALFDWNDSTATADVLARLDAIADGWAAQ